MEYCIKIWNKHLYAYKCGNPPHKRILRTPLFKIKINLIIEYKLSIY